MSMIIQRLAGVVPIFALLAGCGGGGGAPAFAALDSRAVDLAESADTLFNLEGYSNPATLPVDGTATYNGVIGVKVLDGGIDAVGELQLIADFNGPGSISGSAGNFVSDTENRYSGNLAVTNGDILRDADIVNQFTYLADLDGTLSDADDIYLVDGILKGDFIGDDQEYTSGITEGTVASSVGISNFVGLFVAGK